MFFDLRKKEKTTEEKITTLKNRLNSSSYEDDKIEALQNIMSFLLTDLDLVYNICFTDIFNSIQSMDDLSVHYKIFSEILKNKNKNEVVEIICIDKNNALIISNINPDEMEKLINLFDSEEFRNFLIENSNISEIILKLFKNSKYLTVKKFIKNENVVNMLIFEGFIEILLENLYKNKEIYNILIIILKFHKSQDYFMNTENINIFINNCKLKNRKLEFLDFEVLKNILDPLNINFHKYQNHIENLNVVNLAFELKNYDFILKIIFENQNIFQKIVENFLDIKTLIKDSENSLDALSLLEIILKYCENINISEFFKDCKGYRILSLLLCLGYDYPDIKDFLLKDIEMDNISFDMIIFLLLSNYNIFELKIESSSEYYGIFYLLKILKDPEFKYTKFELNMRLTNLRKYLILNKITLSSINEILIETISGLLKDNVVKYEKVKYICNNFDDKEVVQNAEKKNENIKLQDVVYYFKQTFSDKQSFEL